MKITLSQKAFAEALRSGGVAAFTPEGQSEDVRIADATRGSVRITADKKSVTFESTVGQVAAGHTVPIEDKVVAVEKEGSVCVPVKELKQICDKMKEDQTISLEFIPSSAKKDQKKSVVVQPCGDIIGKIGKGGKSSTIEHTLVAYPASEFEEIKGVENASALIKGKADAFRSACGKVAFAINSNDTNEMYHNIGIFDGGNDGKLSFVGTDGRRCAVVSVPKSDFESTSMKGTVLVNLALLTPALEAMGSDVMELADDSGHHIVLRTKTSWVRLAMVDKAVMEKYPDFKKVMAKPIGVDLMVDKESLEEALDHISIANKDRGKYTIKVGAENIIVRSQGVANLKEVKAKVKCDKIGVSLKEDTINLSTWCFISSVKKLTGEKVRVCFTVDERMARVESPDNPEFTYLMQKMSEDAMP